MNTNKKALIVFVVFLYLISFVYAQDYALFSGKFYELKQGEEKIEFEFYNGTYNICESEEKSVSILVVNKEAIDNSYRLDASGVSWASLNVQEFSLPKKQSGVIFLELSPGSNTNGKYTVGVNSLSSIGNVRKNLNLNVNVEKCHSLKLEIQDEDKVCGGTKKQYDGEIINDGKQKIDVDLNLNAPNWVNLDDNSFSIAPNDKEKFELNADIPANAKGIFKLVVGAVIQDLPSIKTEKKLSIEVVPKYDCYKADAISDEKIVNSYSNEFVPIKIRNSGIKQANYEIVIEAPSWVSIEPNKLIINSEQTGNINLQINPSFEIPEGNYPIKIHVKFDDVVYPKNIEIVLSKNIFLKKFKSFSVFYQYYIYVLLLIAIILFIFRRQISNKIKISYKNYKIKQARLRALKAARKARRLKIQLKKLEKAQLEVKKIDKFRRKWISVVSEFTSLTRIRLFFIAVIGAVLILFFSIYQYNFPVSKDFVKSYYVYFIAGILISIFIIFLIEFYKPLFKLLKKIR